MKKYLLIPAMALMTLSLMGQSTRGRNNTTTSPSRPGTTTTKTTTTQSPSRQPSTTPSTQRPGTQNNNKQPGTTTSPQRPNNNPQSPSTQRPGTQNNNKQPGTTTSPQRPNNNPPATQRPGTPPSSTQRPGTPPPSTQRPGTPPPGNRPNTTPPRPQSYRPNYSYRPPRPHTPPSYVYYRPTPPPTWRPNNLTFGNILGLTLGTIISNSVNSLINHGYMVTGYTSNEVYLSNVNYYNVNWPNATLYYNNGYLQGSLFSASTVMYDITRYNYVYNELLRSYGMPISTQNIGSGGMSCTWWGMNNSYVTLSYYPENIPGAGYRYFTTLSVGN